MKRRVHEPVLGSMQFWFKVLCDMTHKIYPE